MTAQSSDGFTNEHPSLALGAWSVFHVMRGEPSSENHGWGERGVSVHRVVPVAPQVVTTANWKGCTALYRLTRSGQLVLDRFDFDDSSRASQLVNETLEGDFYVVLKSNFSGPRAYVPFRQGTIVLDQAEWIHEAYVGNSPNATELRPGRHPDFPHAARLWYQLDWPPDTERS
jgi:hypothetical protein